MADASARHYDAAVLAAVSLLFLAVFGLLAFLTAGGWALFRPPRR